MNLGVNEMGSADFRPIEMENPDFEKGFAVYGTDQVEARYILTPAMMGKILDFRTKVGQDIFFFHLRAQGYSWHSEPMIFKCSNLAFLSKIIFLILKNGEGPFNYL